MSQSKLDRCEKSESATPRLIKNIALHPLRCPISLGVTGTRRRHNDNQAIHGQRFLAAELAGAQSNDPGKFELELVS